MKLRLPRRRVWRVAIYLGSLWLVVTAVDLVLVQVRREIRPGYQTTRIVAPTLPDGRVDYLLAVDEHFGRGVTPENNASVPLLRALGRQAIAPNQPTDGVTDRLGMEPLAGRGDYFVTLGDFRKGRNATSEPAPAEDEGAGGAGTWPPNISPVARDLLGEGWPPVISPRVREWVGVNGGPLDLIVEASRRGRFFIPFYAGTRPETMISVHLKHVVLIRESCAALLTRAAMRLEAGDAAGFREDVLAVHRWARLTGQAHTLVERMVSAALEMGACRVDRLAAGSGRLSAEEARALAAELGRMGDLPSAAESVDAGERYFVLDLCQWMARGGPGNVAILLDQILPAGGSDRVRWQTKLMTRFLPVPYEEAMRSMNQFYDGAVVAWGQPTWAKRREAMRLWQEEGERAASGNLVGVFMRAHWPAIYLLPAFTRAMEVGEGARAELRLARVALALAAYRAERGAYPAELGELGEVPLDPFTDGAFVYARTGEGYRLYSVGANMKDDGGMGKRPGDDIAASLGVAGAGTRPAR
jgi:hypothetical protein